MSNKTHKGIKKRLKKTANGKVMRRHPGKRHLMSKKRQKRARRLSGWDELSEEDRRRFEKQYGKIPD